MDIHTHIHTQRDGRSWHTLRKNLKSNALAQLCQQCATHSNTHKHTHTQAHTDTYRNTQAQTGTHTGTHKHTDAHRNTHTQASSYANITQQHSGTVAQQWQLPQCPRGVANSAMPPARPPPTPYTPICSIRNLTLFPLWFSS